ncbi:sulfotransferase [Dyella acidiphila]|uniref:Sulfotransferase n=1 Tax=Dyella acidiphila TaxID=2775866 RepID=A0ABR9G7E3_9GAMM|nr:sulfotransferase [Dyella acidiphila]MBE1159971.1 sulfotransferase [Dyella acidiphila]
MAENTRAIDTQGLFVLGAARSGTTVLQNALNDSRDIFLFGEPAFHDDPGTPNFAARYNAMHRSWGNQETKSSFCPAFFSGDAAWSEYLRHLATLYRYVGSKIVINPERAQPTCQQVFDFQCRYFYRAHYVFTFRNPIDVLMSTRGLAELNGNAAASCESVLASFVRVIGLYIRMLRNLPTVHAVVHEDIDETVFRDLGLALRVDLAQAGSYYDTKRVRRYSLDDIPASARDSASAVMELYENLRQQLRSGFGLVQLEQNSGHFDISHYTPLGALQRRVDQVLAQLEPAA